MNDTNARPRELPTRSRSLFADDETYRRFRRLALSSGLTGNMTLAALLDCYDAYGEPIRPMSFMRERVSGLPARRRHLLADDETYGRFRQLAAESGVAGNLILAALLNCFDNYGGPIRVEGAGLRIPCPLNAPCAPDMPSAGPVPEVHVKPTRRSEDDLSADELRRRIAAARADEAAAIAQGDRLRKTLLTALAGIGLEN